MYNIRDVYKAFELSGQGTVSLDVNDVNNVTVEEIESSCTNAVFSDVIANLNDIIRSGPLEELRALRNSMLSSTDWVITKSLESGNPVPSEWIAYRQSLRDITDTYDSIETVVWPTEPENN